MGKKREGEVKNGEEMKGVEKKRHVVRRRSSYK